MSVEDLFSEKSYSLRQAVDVSHLSSLDRRKLLGHVVADMTQRILDAPGANPVGLTVTVTEAMLASRPTLDVLATCPRYVLSDAD